MERVRDERPRPSSAEESVMDLDPLLLEILACPCDHHGRSSPTQAALRAAPGAARRSRSATASRSCSSTTRRPGPPASAAARRRPGMSLPLDEALLDDAERLAAADRGATLLALAGAGAQVRDGGDRSRRRPGSPAGRRRTDARALSSSSALGGSAVVGDLLTALAGPSSPGARPGRALEDAARLGRPGRPRRRRVAVRAGRGPARRRRRGRPPRLPAAHRRGARVRRSPT